MRLSLRTRVSVFVAAVVVAISLVSTAFLVSTQKKGMEKEVMARGVALCEALARSVDEGLAAENLNLIKSVEDIVHTDDVLLIQVYSSLWLGVASIPVEKVDIPPDAEAVEHFREMKGRDSNLFKKTVDYTDIYTPVFLETHDPRVPKLLVGYIRLRISTAHLGQTVRDTMIKSILAAVMMTVLAIIVLNVIIGRYVLRPVLKLHSSISKHRKGGFPDMVPVEARDEIGELSSEFNEMSRSLREREERLAEEKEKLAKSEQKYRQIVDTSNEGILVMDENEVVTFVNRRMAEMLGFKEYEVAGKSFRAFIFDEDRADHNEKIKHRKKGVAEAYERRFRRKDGGTLWTIVSATPFFDDEQRFRGAFGMFTDITGRKRAEEALYVSEKRFRDLLETIQLVAVMLDHEGNITFCNDYLLRLTGWSREEVIGKDWVTVFIPEELKTSLSNIFSSHIEGDGSLHNEHPIATRDGVLRMIAWDTALLRDSEGRVIGTASIGYDVTDHRKIEEQLRQAQKLEAIGQLAGGVAHDFNNILSAIVGYAHLTLMNLQKDDFLKGYVEQILRASERATTLTQSLLAFSRKQVIDLKPYDLNEIVRKSEKFLARLIREDIEITTTCAEEELIVMADSGQVEQMLMNLVTNARDAMPKGGHIWIRTEAVMLDEEFVGVHGYGKAGRYVLISVSDTGEGMSAKTRERIFEPFFTTKEQGKGTGLGLSMVYGIVKQHDGYIDVYSEPGRGTTFKIYLPLFRATFPGEKEEGPPDEVRGGSETVLIAEDDGQLRDLTTTMLRQYGYTVIEAVDGEDAVARYVDNIGNVRLVVLDVIMPKMNGKDVYRKIREMTPSVKAVFLSGYAEDIVSKEGLLEEGVSFILKPVAPHDFLKKVREILDS